ncbi:MAG: hypothetical protein A2Y12_10630 [Planctomycetes bacterium GWF2_42_9]|nr:MAG: hypothetical protein A2Y12_10630 [Planctomycetes bacterium GWF2_42_9]
MKVWITDSSERILPETKQRSTRKLDLFGFKDQVISFQVGFRPTLTPAYDQKPLSIKFDGTFAKYCTARLCGLVPVKNHSTGTPLRLTEGKIPGFVPDPLIEDFSEIKFESGQSRSLWITVRLPSRRLNGTVKVTIDAGNEKCFSVEACIYILPFKLPKLDIPVTHWFYSDAICDWYKVEPFSNDYWGLVHKYFRNMSDHNQNTIYTPLFTPPTDGEKMVIQLVGVHDDGKGNYKFNWANLRKWIRMAKNCGFTYFEMSHIFSQWGAKYAIKIIVNKNGKNKFLCSPKTLSTSSIYKNFLNQFLPELVKFLKKEEIFDKTIFHCSDEPDMSHLTQYAKIRRMVRDIAPEIKITETLSNYDFFSSGNVDNPVPNIMNLNDFLTKDVHTWVYYCCVPRFNFPNRFLDYPLFRLRILGLQLFRFQLKGFLHWGSNYWYKHGTTELIDPYFINDGLNWPYWFAGDTFILYPGKDGPVDSVRWQIYRELFDDYRMLCLASKLKGRNKVMNLLSDIQQPDKFPQNADYIRRIRKTLFKCIITHKN